MSLPSYAPTSTTSYTPGARNANQFHQEVTRNSLIKSALHKTVYESLSEIYSIIAALQVLETSFLKDYITDREKYTSTALRLISQFQIIIRDFDEDGQKKEFLSTHFNRPNLQLDSEDGQFLDALTTKYDLHAALAVKRLKVGLPATIEHLKNPVLQQQSTSGRNTPTRAGGKMVAQATGNFITCMDALKLNYRTKYQLHPLLSNLVISLNELHNSPENGGSTIEFPGKSKLVTWLIKLNNLLESEELSQQDVDTFLEDLDTAYKGFFTSLE